MSDRESIEGRAGGATNADPPLSSPVMEATNVRDLQRPCRGRKTAMAKKSQGASIAIFLAMWTIYIGSFLTDWRIATAMFFAGILSHVLNDRISRNG